MDSDEPVTVADVRALAAEFEQLAERVTEVNTRLRADPEEARRQVRFRLDDVAGNSSRCANELLKTASDLARIAAVPASACPAQWGVCPDHGDTLTSSGGVSRCRTLGCSRTWNYDRAGLPCAEPATVPVTIAGETKNFCVGHALSAPTS